MPDTGDTKVNKVQFLSLRGSQLLGRWAERQAGKWEFAGKNARGSVQGATRVQRRGEEVTLPRRETERVGARTGRA